MSKEEERGCGGCILVIVVAVLIYVLVALVVQWKARGEQRLYDLEQQTQKEKP